MLVTVNGQPVTTVELNNTDDNEGNPNSVSYTDRGDPSSVDFSKTDFTADENWHVLDLSSIVPEGASLIHLSISALTEKKDKNSTIVFCKKGISNKLNVAKIGFHHGDKEYFEDKFVVCDTERKIEYLISNVNWIILNVSIRGWF